MNKIIVITFLLPLATLAASFDCTKAKNTNDKIICNSPKLSALDDVLSAKYKQAVSNGDQGLRADQINWLRLIAKKCTNEQCLLDAYQHRINFIQTWNIPVQPDHSTFGNFDVKHKTFIVNPDAKDGYDIVSVHDCMNISKKDTNTINFTINTIGGNGHECSITGSATLKDGIYYYNKGSDTSADDSNCHLTITNRANSLLINDPNNGCHDMACGMRASLNELTFSKNLQISKQCVVEY